MSLVLVDRNVRPHVTVITLNKPERLNSMSFPLVEALYGALAEVEQDNDAWVVVMTGAGRAFCSGLDLHDRGIPPNTQDLGFSRLAMRSMSYMSDVVPAMRRIPQPIIAAINGPAYGGGMCLTLGADIRYAAESAVFCSAGITNGLTSSELGATWLLPRAIGTSNAAELLLTGRRIDGTEAHRIGLVSKVVPDAEVLALALDTAEEMTTTLSCFGVMMTKQSIWSNMEVSSLAAAVELENRNQLLAGYTGNLDEAIEAFRDKRPPVYKEQRVANAEDFNPFDPGQGQNAWPLLERMRAESAVVEIANGMQYVTRLDECRGVLRDPRSFSNATGMKAPGVEVPFEDRLLGELDPPRHTLVRRVVVTALSPKLVHAAEPFMRETAHALLDAMGPTADLVPEFTVPLPNRTTVRMIGLDPDDADQLQTWAKELMESTFPAMNKTDRGDGFAGAFPEFAGYIDDHIEARAAEIAAGTAPDDVLTRLMQITDDGEQLPRRQIRALVRNLITGGFTTTSQLVGNLLHQVLTDPEVERAIRASDDALHNATEESLRLSPPILFMARGCVEDVEIAGCPVHAGTRVITGFASANRDDRLWDDPDTFRVDRPNSGEHLAFGFGPHVCPGASLARAVAYAGVRAFLDHFPEGSVRLAPDFVWENVPTYFEIGPKRLPIVTA